MRQHWEVSEAPWPFAFLDKLLEITIQRWGAGPTVFHVRGAHTHMQTNHKRTDSLGFFLNIYKAVFILSWTSGLLFTAGSWVQRNPSPWIQALAYSIEGWPRQCGRTAARARTGCRRTQPNPSMQQENCQWKLLQENRMMWAKQWKDLSSNLRYKHKNDLEIKTHKALPLRETA